MTVFMVGRSQDCHLVLSNSIVSREHLLLHVESVRPGKLRLFIEDLNSTNGTFIVKGVGVKEVSGRVEVFPSDEIRLGKSDAVKLLVKDILLELERSNLTLVREEFFSGCEENNERASSGNMQPFTRYIIDSESGAHRKKS